MIVSVLAALRDWRERRRSMLQCRQVVELLTDYLEGALPADVHRAVEHHLAHCDSCTAYLQQLRTTVAVLGYLDPPPLDEGVRDDLVALFRDVHRH